MEQRHNGRKRFENVKKNMCENLIQKKYFMTDSPLQLGKATVRLDSIRKYVF